jgi:hypothetical protein
MAADTRATAKPPAIEEEAAHRRRAHRAPRPGAGDVRSRPSSPSPRVRPAPRAWRVDPVPPLSQPDLPRCRGSRPRRRQSGDRTPLASLMQPEFTEPVEGAAQVVKKGPVSRPWRHPCLLRRIAAATGLVLTLMVPLSPARPARIAPTSEAPRAVLPGPKGHASGGDLKERTAEVRRPRRRVGSWRPLFPSSPEGGRTFHTGPARPSTGAACRTAPKQAEDTERQVKRNLRMGCDRQMRSRRS